MKLLGVLLLLLGLAGSQAAVAEIYKWKDKDGVTRYSDIRPPANVPHQVLSGRNLIPQGPPPAANAPVEGAPAGQTMPVPPPAGNASQPPAANAAPAGPAPGNLPPPAAQGRPAPAGGPAGPVPPANDAAKRQQEAEENRKREESKQADFERKQMACSQAKARMQQYTIGGRISRINEKGEREYLSDADIARGLEQAQKEVSESCQ